MICTGSDQFDLSVQKGHGIPESLYQGVRDVVRRFFALPYDEKLKIKLSPSTGFRCAAFHSPSSFFWPRPQIYPSLFVSPWSRGYQRIGENLTDGGRDKQEAVDVWLPLKFSFVSEKAH